MEPVILSSPEDFELLKVRLLEGGLKNLHVLADFDRTLTKGLIDGEKTPSIISVLRNGNYLDGDYAQRAKQLFEKYHPFENDHTITFEERKAKMHEWWKIHYELLIEKGLHYSDLQRVVSEGDITLRDGAEDFLDFLFEKRVPLVILSSVGIGEAIALYLKKWGKYYSNIRIISNSFIWKNGRAIAVKEPIIHVANKDETVLNSFVFFHEIEQRRNVLLLGDSLDDDGMIKGFSHDVLVKIGFLNYDVEKSLEGFKAHYDVIVLNDGDFSFVNSLMKQFT